MSVKVVARVQRVILFLEPSVSSWPSLNLEQITDSVAQSRGPTVPHVLSSRHKTRVVWQTWSEVGALRFFDCLFVCLFFDESIPFHLFIVLIQRDADFSGLKTKILTFPFFLLLGNDLMTGFVCSPWEMCWCRIPRRFVYLIKWSEIPVHGSGPWHKVYLREAVLLILGKCSLGIQVGNMDKGERQWTHNPPPPPSILLKGEARVWSPRSHATGQSLTPVEIEQVEARNGIRLFDQDLNLPGWLPWQIVLISPFPHRTFDFCCGLRSNGSPDRGLEMVRCGGLGSVEYALPCSCSWRCAMLLYWQDLELV